MTNFPLSYNPNTRRGIMRPNKKYVKPTLLLGVVVMGVFSFIGFWEGVKFSVSMGKILL